MFFENFENFTANLEKSFRSLRNFIKMSGKFQGKLNKL